MDPLRIQLPLSLRHASPLKHRNPQGNIPEAAAILAVPREPTEGLAAPIPEVNASPEAPQSLRHAQSSEHLPRQPAPHPSSGPSSARAGKALFLFHNQ
eukprot:1141962-Pelagomonas_calceolata.AAC.3